MKVIRILIATTGGVVAIDRITAERAPQSMVCLGRTSKVLPISGAYDDFVRPGGGVSAREFGSQSYRLDLSDVVGSGESWQLGVFLAHAIARSDSHELAGSDTVAQNTYLVTGRVNYDLEIESVDHIDEKMNAAAPAFKSADGALDVILPHGANADRVNALLIDVVAGIHPCARIADALSVIGLLASMPPVKMTQDTLLVVQRGSSRPLLSVLLVGLAIIGIFWGVLSWHQGDIINAADEATYEKPAEVKLEAASLGSVKIYGKFPPSGKRCADLLFSKTEPVIRRHETGVARPCGFRLRIMPELPARFAGIVVDRRSGRLIEAISRVEGLKGGRPVSGPLNIDLDVPLRQREPIDFRIVTIFGEHPVVDMMTRLRLDRKFKIDSKNTNHEVKETNIKLHPQ